MNTLVLKIASLVMGTSAIATAAADQNLQPAGHNGTSKLLGSWAVDVSHLPIPPEARPKSVTISFDAAVDGRWTMHVEIVDGVGHETDASANYTLDGKQIAVTGRVARRLTPVRRRCPHRMSSYSL